MTPPGSLKTSVGDGAVFPAVWFRHQDSMGHPAASRSNAEINPRLGAAPSTNSTRSIFSTDSLAMTAQIPAPILREIEKRGESIQMGIAASCAGGLLAILSLDKPSPYLWWASFLFCVGLPCGLARGLMSFTALTFDTFINPIGWMMYPLGIISCVAAFAGYVLMGFHVSYHHGLTLMIATGIGFIWLKVHARAVGRQRLARFQEEQKTSVHSDAEE